MSEPFSPCNVSKPSTESEVQFLYFSCQTPIVTDVSPQNGYNSTLITIRGIGFSDKSCHNKVSFSDHSCVVQSSSSSEVTCILDMTTKPQVGKKMPVALNVHNRGKAVVESGHFTLQPVIDSISPNSGSKKGGTKITIKGSGFADLMSSNVVNIASGCTIISATYSELVCTSKDPGKDFSEDPQQVSVTVNKIKSNCSNLSGCVFAFKAVNTPMVTEFFPTTVNQTFQTIKFFGSGFPTSKLDVHVKMGSVACEVTESFEGKIECSLPGLVAGTHDVVVNVDLKGDAQFSTSSRITSEALLSLVSPSSIGKNGGVELTLQGNGFDSLENKTTVTVAGKHCPVTTVVVNIIKCTAPAHTCGTSVCDARVIVTVNSKNHPVGIVVFDDADTPSVSSISPNASRGGDLLTVTGNFKSSSSDNITVVIGGKSCQVTTATSSQITCKLSPRAAGTFPVNVMVANKGLATSTAVFTYKVEINSVSPSESGFGGERVITVRGYGFSAAAEVTICGSTCPLVSLDNTTESQLFCSVPPNKQDSPGSGARRLCSVRISLSGQTFEKSDVFTYKDSLTSIITSVSPIRGGTGGGDVLTIKGSGLDTIPSNNKVTIDGAMCDVTTASSNRLICTTRAHSKTIEALVRVEVGNTGIALGEATYWYVDQWSSKFSWGNKDPPKKG